MNSPLIYPWGPLLSKQVVSNLVSDVFLQDLGKGGDEAKVGVVPIHKRYNYNLDNPKYLDLLLPYFHNYLKKITPLNYKLKLKLLMGNVYGSNDYIPPHIHSNCDLSFVLFLKTPSPHLLNSQTNEGNICFEYGEPKDNRSKLNCIYIHTINPQINDLFIFPNYLRHYSIPIKNPQAQRISLAGNIELL